LKSREVEVLETLIKEIRRVAEEEVEKILSEAKAKADSIMKEARKKAEEVRRKKIEKATREARLKFRREIAVKKLEMRHKFLREKEKIMNELLNEATKVAMEHIKRQDEVYLEGLKSLLTEAIRNIGGNEILVACNERDKELVEKVIKEVVAEAKKRGRNISVRIAESIECLGGVLVYSVDEREYYNNTIEARIRLLKSEVLPKILWKLSREQGR